MPEPSSLLRRLTALERRIVELEDNERKSAAQAGNARHQGIFHEMLLDDVVLPMLLLFGGQGGKTALLDALQAVKERLPDHPGIPGAVARYYEADLQGWQNAVLAIPDWHPLSFEERYPGDPDERGDL